MNYKKLHIIAFAALLPVVVAGWWASSQMEEITRIKTSQSLEAVLSGTVVSIKNWAKERLDDVKATAANRFFVALVEKQLALPKNAEQLKAGPYNAEIEEFLRPLIKEKDYRAYILVDRNRVVISASQKAALGLPSFLAGRGEFIDTALEGRALVSPILKVESGQLVPAAGKENAREPCLFLLSPVRDNQNIIIAVLALAMDPASNLDKLTSLAVFNNTGETYVFDQYGQMVTSSRFEDQLRRLGLLEPGRPSAGNLEMRNPGVDLTKGLKPAVPREDQPYTLLAQEALAGQSGRDFQGYRDYRGVMVVGVWTWDKDLGLGIATEVDRSEMFQTLNQIRTLSLAVLILTLTASATLVALVWRSRLKATRLSAELQTALNKKRQEEKQRKAAEKSLLQSRESLAHAQAVAHVGSFDWRFKSDYITWSDEMFRIFGWDKNDEKVGFKKAMDTVHPEDAAKIRKSMNDLIELGVDYEINHRIVRPDGEIRWLESKAELLKDATGAAVGIVGTGRDITEEKAVQEELDNYRNNLEQQVSDRTVKLTALNQKLEKEIEERELAQRRIRLNEARLNSLVATAVEGIVTIDEKSVIKTFNPAAEKIFGYSAEQAIGQNVMILMPEPIRSRHQGYVERYLRTGEEKIIGRTREVPGLHKDGQQIELEISISVFKDGEHPVFTGILHDINERKKTEQALKKAKREAEAANQAKSRFLANMSHEIRTPMNSIIGYLDLALEEPSLPSGMKKSLSTASRSAGALLRLINDILDVSKMEAGKLELEHSRFNLHRLLEDILESFDRSVRKKGLTLDLRIHPDLVQCYLGDHTRLRQVLVNLLSNAVKFTPKGGISISAEPSGQGNQIRFAVSDTGIGISEDKLDSILEPFTQADVTTTRKFGGTGLGTTISRQIVEMMNGSIWIQSEEGKGSTFFFTVELPESECSATCNFNCEDFRARSGLASGPVSMRAFKVLLAEDLPENAELARIRLEKAGHHVTHAWNGIEAVAKFGKDDFDLILMDVQMPEMDGLEATRQIRMLEKGTGRHVPIIALTASVMREEKERCLGSGNGRRGGKAGGFSHPVRQDGKSGARRKGPRGGIGPSRTQTGSDKGFSRPAKR